MKNLKMSNKLLLGYAIVITLTLVVGGIGMFGLFKINGSYTQAYIDTALPLPIIANAMETITDISVNLRDAIIFADDPVTLNEAAVNVSEAMRRFEFYMAEYALTITNPDSQVEFYKAFNVYENNYKPAAQKIIGLAQSGDTSGAAEILDNAKQARLTISENLRDCLQYDSAEGENKNADNMALSRILIILLIGVIFLVVAVSILIALFLSNMISKPVVFMKDVLSRIGLKGDLVFTREEYAQTEQYAAYKDEVGQSVGMLLITVHRLVEVGQSLEKVAAGNLTSEIVLLSDEDSMGKSLQKMTENLDSMFHELEQQAEALRQARDLAVQNSHYKSEFLSRMSHEIRTPMNAIIGMTNLAKNADHIERKDYCLNKIDSASMHLLGVINDVLDMSKIEAGKLDLSMTTFNLEKMLIKITNVVNFRIEEKRQIFHIKIERDVPEAIVSDEQRLSQVITNLLSNSNKFTPEDGDISLFVRKLGEHDGFCTLEFEVRDTGIGISEEQQQKLFQPFEQADGTISRKFGGSGLGLAISRRIVEMLGGDIHIQSRVGEGSSFIFTMRAEIGQAINPIPIASTISWDNLRVLAVDDDDDVREFFTDMRGSYDINCAVAAGGIEALDLIGKESPYNIIFVDWKMPGMDGVALTQEIKERYGVNTVVIMISAMEWSVIEPDARRAGVDGFISKPLFGSQIVECINEYINPSQQTGTDGSAATDDGFLKGKRILLAEDIEINREIVIAMLEHTGVQIDCAEDGSEAYRMFKENPNYDMIFMDVHMPNVDGHEATKMIRALDHPRAKTVPITAMTASVFKEEIEKCLASGMNSHIGKPLEFDMVIENIKQYVAL